MLSPQAKLGSWWLFIVCQNPKCCRDLLLAEVPSPQQQPQMKVEGGRMTCPHCLTLNTYRAEQVRRSQVTGLQRSALYAESRQTMTKRKTQS
jgi:hypothetical protein